MAANIPKSAPPTPTYCGVVWCIFPRQPSALCPTNWGKFGLFYRGAFVIALSLCLWGNFTSEGFLPVAACNSTQSSSTPQPSPHTPAFRRLMYSQKKTDKNGEEKPAGFPETKPMQSPVDTVSSPKITPLMKYLLQQGQAKRNNKIQGVSNEPTKPIQLPVDTVSLPMQTAVGKYLQDLDRRKNETQGDSNEPKYQMEIELIQKQLELFSVNNIPINCASLAALNKKAKEKNVEVNTEVPHTPQVVKPENDKDTAAGFGLAKRVSQEVRGAPQGLEVAGNSLLGPYAVKEKKSRTPCEDQGKNLKLFLPIALVAAVLPPVMLAITRAWRTSRPRGDAAAKDKTTAAEQTKASDSDQDDMLPLSRNSNVESHFGRSR
eukprot:GHVT01059932.1.p1 GENE.GHVT01059932.1~~GHVT01059932.1.p1  ORF type:complete len:376 (-),score=44.35 GHVT01059932.1:454-1581(-)